MAQDGKDMGEKHICFSYSFRCGGLQASCHVHVFWPKLPVLRKPWNRWSQDYQGCLVQVGNGMESEAVGLQFEPIGGALVV